MDRLTSMRVFQQVAEGGSFSGAARDLDLSPAVVTRLVADLESHLGARLLQRTTRRVSLTEAGQAYLERIRHILQDIEEADAQVSAQTEDMSGVLRIQAPSIPAAYILAPLVAGFRQLHPSVTFDINVDDLHVLRLEEHDIALMGIEGQFDANVIARPVIQSNGVLVASPDYARRKPLPQSVADLQAHECLRLKVPGARPTVWTLTRRDDPAVVEEVTVPPAIWSNHLSTLLRATMEGAGIAAMPIELVAPMLAAGQLTAVLPQWGTGQFTLYAALPSRRFIPRRTRVFLDYLTEHTRAMADDILKELCPSGACSVSSFPLSVRNAARR